MLRAKKEKGGLTSAAHRAASILHDRQAVWEYQSDFNTGLFPPTWQHQAQFLSDRGTIWGLLFGSVSFAKLSTKLTIL